MKLAEALGIRADLQKRIARLNVRLKDDTKVREGDVTVEDPKDLWTEYRNTMVHGLTAADTENKPVFPFVWKDVAPKIAGLPLVAHNKRAVEIATERWLHEFSAVLGANITFKNLKHCDCTIR